MLTEVEGFEKLLQAACWWLQHRLKQECRLSLTCCYDNLTKVAPHVIRSDTIIGAEISDSMMWTRTLDSERYLTCKGY
jgi:hypothetical protein